MVQQVEAWGNVLEFPDDMSDEDMADAIRKNEVHLNPDASLLTKGKAAASQAIDAGLSMLTPKKSIAQQAEEQSAATAGLAAPQVQGAPVRRDFYNRMVAETPQGPTVPDTGIISQTRNAAAQDKKAQGGKQAVVNAITSTEPTEEEGGFAASAARTVGQNIKGAGQVASDFFGADKDNAATKLGRSIIEDNPTAVNELSDIAERPGTAIAEATGNAAPSMAGMIGARAVGQGITALSPLTGPAAPLVAAAGQVVSWLGPAAIAALPSFGGIRDKQTLSDPKNEESSKAKIVALLGAGAVGAIEQAFGPQQWAMAALTKEGRTQLAAKFAATTLGGSIGKGVLKGAATEGAEELVQNPIEQLAAFDDPRTPENIKETIFGGAMGAIGGGVLGGGVPIISGKPVTEHSDNVLKYTAKRGGEKAKEAAQAELKRREEQGADPSVRNAPESTTDAVDRIISTGKDKAQEIRGDEQEAPDAILDDVFDEDSPTVQDAPTPEPVETLNAQITALEEGRKPGVLLTPGEPMPETLPEGVQAAEIPDRGILLYRDEATLQAAQDGRMGEALGYGIDEKPNTDQVITARDADGTVIQDVATDGRPEVEQAAAAVAGPDGTVEVRLVGEALAERESNSVELHQIKTAEGTTPKANDGAVLDKNLASEGTKPLTDKQIAHRKRLSKKAKERRFINSSDTLNQAIIKLGGIHESLRLDLTGDTKGNTKLPFVGALFTKKGTQDLSDIANQLQSYGYFTEEEINDVDGGAALLAERLRSEFNGAEVHRALDSDNADEALQKHYEEMQFQAQLEAEARGFEFDGVIQPEDIEVEGKQANAINLVDAELLARAIALDAQHVDMLAQEFEDSLDLFMQSIEEFIHEKENEGLGVDEDWLSGSQAVQSEEDIFGLESQSEEELKAAEAEKEKAEKEAKKKADAEEKTRKAAAEKKEIEQRGKNAATDFVLGGNAMDELAGQKDIFSQPAKKESPPKDTPAPKEEPKTPSIRPLVESLIKRRAAARQGGKDLSNAIDRAKEVMDGKRTDAKVEGRYFRLQAKAFEKADPEAAKILGQIAESIKDNAPKLSRTESTQSGPSVPDVQKAIEPLQKAGFKKINVVATQADLPQKVKEQIKSKNAGNVRGVYLPDSDEIFIVADQLNNANEAVMVALHEARHRGLRKVFGSGLDPVMRQIYATNKRVRTAADRMMQSDKDMSKEEATEEVLADMPIDQAKELNGWKRLVKFIKEWIAEKLDLTFTDEMVEQLVAGAQSVGMSESQIDTAAFKKWFGDSKVVDESGGPLVVYHGTAWDFSKFGDDADVKLFQGLTGTDGTFFFTNDADLAGDYAKEQNIDGEGANVMPTYLSLNNPLTVDAKGLTGRKATLAFISEQLGNMAEGKHDGLIIHNIDDQIGDHRNSGGTIYIATKREQIKSAIGNDGSFDKNNPDIRLSRTPGNNASWNAPEPSKIDNLIYSLQNKHIDLKRVIQSIESTGKKLDDKWDANLQEELFHERAAKRVKDFVNHEQKGVISALRLRNLSVDELDKYLHARHAQEANALIAQRDPKMPDGGSGMTNKEAQDYLANLAPEKRRKLDQTARKVDDIIGKTRDLYVSYGLIDQATADSWQTMFQHYVPLMREDKDGGMGIGQGFSIKGKEAKHRTGSKRAVVDILANIALQRERAIVRGEKNRVATSLYGLAKLNPNPEFWTTENVPQRHFDEKTGQVVERADPMYKSRNNVVVAKVRDSKGKVTERAVVFNEDNERAMRMATAIKNLDATQLEGLMGVSAKVTRYFAAINTQYNPVFGVVNLIRDLQASLLNLSSTPIAGSKAAVIKNIIPAIHAIYSASRGERKGTQATSAMSQLWDEMQKEGGMTGYRDLFKTSEDRANAIKHELDPTAWMNSNLGKVFTANGTLKVPLAVAQKQAKWLFDWLSDYNQTLEGAMRLSVYKVAIDKGLSKPRAASIAKNISVNFNRKGQSGQQAGALYAFFNAAMQGTARIGETMTSMDKGDIKTLKFNSTGKKIIAGGITLGAVQALALAAAGFDDDEPPEFVRERSLIIPIGDKKYVTIPMPLGFHAIPNVGRISTEYALSGFKKPEERVAQLFMIFAEAFNPIGSSSTLTQTLSPTATDPLVALSENKDWTGKPIAKEDFNKLSPTPGFSRNKDTATAPAKWIAETINTISGGNKYVPGMFSPTADQIDFLVGQVTGGVGRESAKAQQSITAAITGEELPPHKIPLVGRFYGSSDNSSSHGNAFYKNLKRINEVEAELKGRRKDRLPVDEFKAENPEHRLVVRANFVERLVSKQRKKKSELLEKKAPREEVKAVEDRITNLMAGFNSKVKELREEARQ